MPASGDLYIKNMSNHITIKPNGPLVIKGKLKLFDAQGNHLVTENELYLCRCGHSANKPYCDGSHKRFGFEDSGEFIDKKSEPMEQDVSLEISIRPDAMLIAKGPMVIESKDGSSHTTRNKAALCRCGHSKNKPFCDASHKHCGFSD